MESPIRINLKIQFIKGLCFMILCFLSINGYNQVAQASFIAPDTVCVNTPFTLSSNDTNNYWNFCTGNLNNNPVCTSLSDLSLSRPVFMDFAEENGNYYGFVVNNDATLTELFFGNSLLNNPTTKSWGSFNGQIPFNSEGIKLVFNENKWYAIIVGGLETAGTASIVRISFGASLSNTTTTLPIATNWGNTGGLNYPVGLDIIKVGNDWYGFTVNAFSNTFTRFNFGTSFENTPTSTSINVSGLSFPTGLHFINNLGNWSVFITNAGGGGIDASPSSLSRIDFGSSILNTNPISKNLGNLGGTLQSPRDIHIFKQCNSTIGYVVNHNSKNDIVRIKLDDNLDVTSQVSLGNIGNFSFPHSISKIFRVDADVYSFVVNVDNASLTRLQFPGCNNANIPNSSLKNPSIIYNTPGTYNINLTIDEGLPTQSSFCKQIVVLPPSTNLDFNFTQDECNPLMITLQNKSNPLIGFNYTWDFGDGSSTNGLNNLTAYKYYNKLNDYTVSLSNTSGCSDTIKKTIPVWVKADSLITTNDTTICIATSIQLKTIDSVTNAQTYCWLPTLGLSNSKIQNPIATPTSSTTYTILVKSIGNNLVVNGDFEQGNTLFSTTYKDTIIGYPEWSYTVDTTAAIWHPFIARCHDHTSGKGKMLIANGAPTSGKAIWQQTIDNILPNTNYIFSTWLQSMSIENPAQIRFYVNGQPIGESFSAVLDTCFWQQPLTTWNSGNNTTATIAIIDEDTIGNGNDFALDDISFYSNSIKSDSVRITVNFIPHSPTVDTTICAGQSIMLTAATANTYTWNASPYISNKNLQSQTFTPTNSTQLIVNRFNATSCSVSDTFNVTVSNNKPQLDFSFTEDICNPLSVQFKNESIGNFNYLWSFGNNTFNNNLNPSLTYTNYGSYPVKLKNTTGCPDSITKNITIGFVIDSAIITNDTIICPNKQLQLASINALAYCWSPSIGLSNTDIKNPTLTVPTTSTTYYLNAKVVQNNLIVNGDFENGFTGFNSDYSKNISSGLDAGVYTVSSSPKSWHRSFTNCPDHTLGTGKFMLVNGAFTPGTIVWNEPINIQPNTNYAFSAWAESLTEGNPAQLQFTINGKTIGSIFTAEYNTCIWKQFYVVWNSGDTTKANISIINLNNASGGNDFALDDISFAKISILRDSVTITPAPIPTVSITNKDTSLCVTDSFQLIATGASKYNWNNSSYLSSTTIANPIAKPLLNTSFTVIGFNANGCSASGTLKVIVNNIPLITVTPNTSTCLGDSIQLSANSNNAKSYSWQNNTSLSALNISNPFAKPLDTTNYIVTVTDNNNCLNKDSVQVLVWILPTVKTRTDTSICFNTNTILNTKSTNATNIVWSPAIGLSDTKAQSPTDTASFLGTNQYIVTAFNSHGCSAMDTVYITGKALPLVTITNANPISICEGKSVSLSAIANNVKTFKWFPSTGLNVDTVSNPIANPIINTKYFITVTGQNDCKATDSILIDVKQIPNFSITPTIASVCKNDSLLITASGGNKYSWDAGNNVKYPDSSANIVYPIANTTYKIIASDTICGISKPLTVSVKLDGSPDVNVYKTNDIDCILTTSTLIANGAASYIWSPVNTLSDSTSASTIATPSQTTIYNLKAISSSGCITEKSIKVNVTKGDIGNAYQIPNAFTPMLSSNTCFGVKEWRHVNSFSMNIYNRYGQQLFSTNSLNGCWDGRFNGILQAAGTYIVEIDASTLCAEIHRKGTVVLLR